MNNSHQPNDFTAHNDRVLTRLAWAIEASQGQFSLILARCNYASLREQMVQRLRECCPVEIRVIVLKHTVKTLYTTIRDELGEEQPEALMVLGLESVRDIDRVLTSTNQVREEFRKNFPFPLVLWVNDELVEKLIRLAPDFENWATSVEFAIATENLLVDLRQRADYLFTKILELGAEPFLSNDTIFGANYRRETHAALQDLRDRGEELTPELQASVDFVLGRDAYANDEIDAAIALYQKSLAFWAGAAPLTPQLWGEPKSQNPPELRAGAAPLAPQPWGESESQSPPELGDLGGERDGSQNPKLRAGILLFHLGLCFCRQAERYGNENCYCWEEARRYVQQCIDGFEQAQRQDLVAKFINQLGEILRSQKDWEQLHNLAQKALALHQTYHHPVLLAQDYGFLAEVALEQSHWTEAHQAAQTALDRITQVPLEQRRHQNLYLLLLARSQQQLGQYTDAIANLETARKIGAQDHPQLYLRILKILQTLYCEQKNYLEAFRVKQEQRSVEQQYGFRAFIGAGRIKAQRQARSAVAQAEYQAMVAQEIAASGRQQDVERLIKRIGDTQHKLTVLYGQSGVGKSSMVDAGLIPALKERAIGTRDVLPVRQRVYTHWIEELGNCLAAALADVAGRKESIPKCDSLEGILEQLRQNEHRNLLTVLIFDQFEEFFFVGKHRADQERFAEFFHNCLNIPFVKVILSLREDYLHLVLRCSRKVKLDVINNNILDKEILYYVGSFSPEDAKSIIRSLTQRSQFYLEPELVEALVQDLASELGEVRPIELQVVGAQLQTENITTLTQYREHGPKEQLVHRYLQEVVADCGTEHQRAAELVLYLLTDENNTRPLKTRAELESDLKALAADLAEEANNLGLVLRIFVESGLVFLLPEIPDERYQLVHDYLVTFIRQQQSNEIIEQLEAERKHRKRSEAELTRVLKRQLKAALLGGLGLATLAALAVGFGIQASISETNARIRELTLSSDSLFNSNKGLDALIEGLKVGKQIKHSFGVYDDTRMRTIANLQQVVYGVRERNRLEGHRDEVTSVTFSPNGKLLASGGGSKDKSVKLWRIDGKLLENLSGHADSVTSVSFSPDSQIIASASKDKSVKVWGLDGHLLHTLPGHTASVTSVSFSPDGKLLASASEDTTVKLWSLDGQLIKTLSGHDDSVISVSFSPDGKLLASASKDYRVKLWRHDGTLVKTIYCPQVTSASFSRDGQTLVCVSKYDVKLWSLDGTLIKTVDIESYNLASVSFSPEGKTIAFSTKDDYDYTVSFAKRSNGVWNKSSFSFAGHSSPITSLSFSPDGKLIASASRDKTVKIWNLDSTNFKPDEDQNNASTSPVFSPDGQTIALSGDNNKVNLWRRDSTLLRTIPSFSSAVIFSPNGKLIASASFNDLVRIWQRNSDEIKALYGHKSDINDLSFSPDGNFIASASADKTVKLWQSDGSLIKTLEGHTDSVTNVSFSPNSKIIASIGRDNTVRLWRSDGTLIKLIKGHSNRVDTVSFNHNSQMLATVGDDNIVNLWRNDGTFITALKGHEQEIYDVQFSTDDKTIATVDYNNIVKLWRTNDGSLMTTCDEIGSYVRFSLDGKTIASVKNDKTVKLWRFNCTSLKTYEEEKNSITDIQLSPNSQAIAILSKNQMVKIWNPDSQEITSILGKSNNNITNVNFSRDSRTIAFDVTPTDKKDVDTRDKTVQIWSLDGKKIKTIGERSNPIWYTIALSPNGQTIAARSYDDAVKLWRNDGTLLKSITGHSDYINDVSFSADGKLLASASADKTIKLWSNDGYLVKTLHEHSDAVNSVSFSPDGKMLVSGSKDSAIKLWGRDGSLIRTLQGHKDGVNSVSFSPDGKTIASASDDSTIKLWHLNGKNFKTLNVYGYGVSNVRFSPDGQLIASASSDGVKLWSHDGILLKSFPWSIFGYSKISFSPDGKFIAALRYKGGAAVWSLDLDELLVRGCNQVRDYLKNNPNVKESDRHLCDGIGTSNST